MRTQLDVVFAGRFPENIVRMQGVLGGAGGVLVGCCQVGYHCQVDTTVDTFPSLPCYHHCQTSKHIFMPDLSSRSCLLIETSRTSSRTPHSPQMYLPFPCGFTPNNRSQVAT